MNSINNYRFELPIEILSTLNLYDNFNSLYNDFNFDKHNKEHTKKFKKIINNIIGSRDKTDYGILVINKKIIRQPTFASNIQHTTPITTFLNMNDFIHDLHNKLNMKMDKHKLFIFIADKLKTCIKEDILIGHHLATNIVDIICEYIELYCLESSSV